MVHLRLSRRNLAAGFAAGSLGYLLARSLPAHAQRGERRLKRFVVVYMPEGPNLRAWSGGNSGFLLTDAWCPQGAGADHPIGALSPILAGFERLKSDLLVVDGLSNEGFIKNGDFGNHFHGLGTVGTGTVKGTGDSIDQVLAPVLRGSDDHVRPSIHLGVGSGFGVSRRAGRTVTGWRSPAEAFDKLFRDLTPASTAAPGLGEDEKRRRLAEVSLAEYKALRGQVGREEQERIDANVEALTDLQKRIAAARATPSAGRCDAAALKASAGAYAVTGGWDKVVPRMMDVVANAFACDVTRVATVEIGRPYGDRLTYPWLGVTEPHHYWAHQYGGNNPRRQAALGKVYRWYFDQVAHLAERLKAIPDPNGGTLLDTTGIITVSEFGDGHHRGDHMATVLVGGRAAGVKGGRVLHFGSATQAMQRPGTCQPMNRFYLSLCNQLAGLSLKTFGEPSFCAGGPLSGIV